MLPESTGGMVVVEFCALDDEGNGVIIVYGIANLEELLGELIVFKVDLIDMEDSEEFELGSVEINEDNEEDDGELVDTDGLDEFWAVDNVGGVDDTEGLNEENDLVDGGARIDVSLFEDVDVDSNSNELDVAETLDSANVEEEESIGDGNDVAKVDVLEEHNTVEETSVIVVKSVKLD